MTRSTHAISRSARSERLVPRTRTADKVVQSICAYGAVGCGQKVYVKDGKDGKVIEIEGDHAPVGKSGTVSTRMRFP